jgi:hypothetical protein
METGERKHHNFGYRHVIVSFFLRDDVFQVNDETTTGGYTWYCWIGDEPLV